MNQPSSIIDLVEIDHRIRAMPRVHGWDIGCSVYRDQIRFFCRIRRHYAATVATGYKLTIADAVEEAITQAMKLEQSEQDKRNETRAITSGKAEVIK